MAEIVPDMATPPPPRPVGLAVPYEEYLSASFERAVNEGGLFFEGRSKVQITLFRIAKQLEELGIPYAVAGGMALSAHGFRRFTDDVDILVNQDGLRRVHEALNGKGYVPPFSKSKNLRDIETGVKVEFILTGGFPGDGKPKPVSFPEPYDVAEVRDGIRCVNLQTLVELKLASGMTGVGRLKDLGDVQELIRTLRLPKNFGENLNPYVRSKFEQLWFPPSPEGTDEP